MIDEPGEGERLETLEALLHVVDVLGDDLEPLAGRPDARDLVERILEIAEVEGECAEVPVEQADARELPAGLPVAQGAEVRGAVALRGGRLRQARPGPDQAKRLGDG